MDRIFDEQLFPDFVLMFRLLHASRLAVPSGALPVSCWLEQWRANALKQGERALERLRDGVKQAITTVGTGFLHHPANSELRTRLAAGTLARDDYKRAVLRLVYRLLFWFVAEDRDVLLDPDMPTAARAHYARFFSAQRLRDRARRVDTRVASQAVRPEPQVYSCALGPSHGFAAETMGREAPPNTHRRAPRVMCPGRSLVVGSA